MQEFILTIAKKDLHSLGAVRCVDGLKAAVDAGAIWLRGLSNDSLQLLPVKQLPVTQQFSLGSGELLFPAGSVAPAGVLQKMEWKTLTDFLPVELPPSAGPGVLPEPMQIRLIPSTTIHKGEALLTSLGIWKKYGETAPGIRLDRLKFAVSSNSEVLVLGEPLPSLPGSEFWKNGDMLLPCGYDFSFPLASLILNDQICNGQSLIVFAPDGSWFAIDHHFFVPATRSAIRMTKMEYTNG